MAGRIPQPFIDELVQRVDIVGLIDSRVPLKKAGRNFQACCPFHNEKTPSFSVSPEKQFYHCFGCGASGNAISFLMNHDGLTFREAVETLAPLAGLTLPQPDPNSTYTRPPAPPPEYDPYALMQAASAFFIQQLQRHPEAAKAHAYLQQRGLSAEVIQRYAIGYAPSGWDLLLKTLRYPPHQLEQMGLVIRREEHNSWYDRFRDRVIFPIRDRRGRVIAFGGRVLTDEKPKYLNSPETALFNKSHELYGLYEARQQRTDLKSILVVEGYLDVVALAQFGIHNAVATLGTAITDHHLQQIFRIAEEVIFCFDGDEAGRKAAWRGLEHGMKQLQGERQIRFHFLPEGEDPDSRVRRIGAEAFRAELQQAVPLSSYLFSEASRRCDLRQLEGQSRFIALLTPLFASLTVTPFAQMLLEQSAQKLHLDSRKLAALLQRPDLLLTPDPAPSNRFPSRSSSTTQPITLMRRTIWMVLHQPELGRQVDAESLAALATLQQPGAPLLVELLRYIQSQSHCSMGQILEHGRDRPEWIHLNKLAQQPHLLGADADLEVEFQAAIQEFKLQRLRQERSDLLQRFREKSLTAAERQRYTELGQLLTNRRAAST